MSILNILLLILGISLLIVLIIPLIILILHYRDYCKRMECVRLCETTAQKLIDKKTYLTGIEAKVGGGKSALLCGISHTDTIRYQEDVKSYQQHVQIILPEVNFKWLNGLIDLKYAATNNTRTVYQELLKIETVRDYFQGIYSDHVSEFPKYTLLKKYIDSRCAQLREKYVGANFKIYNRFTNNFNFEYELEQLEIKDEEKQKNYILPRYCSYFFDEALTSKYRNVNSNSIVGDTGLDLLMRLIRHLSEETNRIYLTAQTLGRMSKLIRELGTCFISINKLEVVGIMKTLDSFLKKKEERLRDKVQDDEELMLQDNKIKRRLNLVYDKRKKLFASNYLKFSVIFYDKVDDAGKAVDKCDGSAEEFDLYFPLTWCFGVYDTTEFKFIDEFLASVSNKSDIDLRIAKASLSELEKKDKAKLILAKTEKEDDKEKKGKSQSTKFADLG